VFGVLGLLPAGDDELPGAEQQRDDLGFVEAVDQSRNCSGSYSMFSRPRPMAMAFRLSWRPRSALVTMFWTTISGSSSTLMERSRSLSKTMRRDSWTSSVDFAPVQTIFPERKMSAALFGSWVR